MRIEKLFSRYKSIVGDFQSFIEFCNKPLAQSFRLNTLKAKRDEILGLLHDVRMRQLEYYSDGFVLEEKAKLGNHITHNLGLIYVQEIASMIPVLVLGPKPGEVVLDACAAPGSKTTQIAQFMDNTGLLLANEMSYKRALGLIFNCKRCGLLNEVIINFHGQKLDRMFTDYFDRVLIDAPCSAEGTIRKSKAVLFHWGLNNIHKMATIQKGLIVAGFRALRPGGTLVYSTCTIAPEENEGVVSYLLEKFPEAELLTIAIPHFTTRPGILRWEQESFDKRVAGCVRILPQDNDTAPFFVAKITKRGVYKGRIDYIGKIGYEGASVELIHRRFGISIEQFKGFSVFQQRNESFIATPQVFSFREVRALRKGLELGKIYDHEVKPDNDFIQLFGRKPERNFYDMREWQVKRFLEGQTIKTTPLPDISNGFVIVMYRNLPIAIGRYNGTEIKSAVKRERRIPA